MRNLTFAILLFLASAALGAETVDGTWTATFRTMGGTQMLTWVLSAKDGKLTGRASTGSAQNPIDKGLVSGSHVTWLEVDRIDGNQVTMKYEGTLKGDTMQLARTPVLNAGSRTPDFGSGGFATEDTATAKRTK